MNNNKSIVLASGAELQYSVIQPKVMEYAKTLIRTCPGGKKLTESEATYLAVFSVVNDLNPFEGEAYYMPNAGPIAGVPAYRRKANEYLIRRYGTGPLSTFKTDFRLAATSEAQYDPDKNDIAWVCMLYDLHQDQLWQQQVISNMAGLRAAGMEGKELREYAEHLAGPRPITEAVGVVKASENFGPDKWDRNERAKKRAEKAAIRKAYPVGVNIVGDAETGEIIDGVARDLVMDVSSQLAAGEPKSDHTETQLMTDLGFGPVAQKDAPAVVDVASTIPPEPEYVPPVDEPKPAAATPQQAAVDAGACPDIFQANAWFERCALPTKKTASTFVQWCKAVQGWIDSTGCGLEQAAAKANKGEVP